MKELKSKNNSLFINTVQNKKSPLKTLFCSPMFSSHHMEDEGHFKVNLSLLYKSLSK